MRSFSGLHFVDVPVAEDEESFTTTDSSCVLLSNWHGSLVASCPVEPQTNQPLPRREEAAADTPELPEETTVLCCLSLRCWQFSFDSPHKNSACVSVESARDHGHGAVCGLASWTSFTGTRRVRCRERRLGLQAESMLKCMRGRHLRVFAIDSAAHRVDLHCARVNELRNRRSVSRGRSTPTPTALVPGGVMQGCKSIWPLLLYTAVCMPSPKKI